MIINESSKLTFQSQRYRQQTFITLLVYLNDDFNDGTTNYWTNHEGIHCRFLRDVVS